MEKRKKHRDNEEDINKNKKKENTHSIPPKPPLFSWEKAAKRFALIFLMLGFVYWNSLKKDESSVKQKEYLERYAKQVPCSSDYEREQHLFRECIPKRCGRVITDGLIAAEETAHLLSVAKKSFAISSSNGGASIVDLHSGAISRGNSFVNIYKLENGKKIFTEEDFNIYSKVQKKIHMKVSMEFGILPHYLYLTHPTFFSKMNAKPPQTDHDEYWHPHVDKETYPSFHYTSLLYLSDFSKDFTGGRFVFIDSEKNMTIEPRSGRVSMFTSGSENTHFVEKVKTGERFALTVSFTCDKKYAIQEPGKQQHH